MYEQIRYEVTDPMATITLNRPEALNAWTTRMGAEVKHAVARAEADKSVVAIVITGEGRGFCAGADLNDLQDISDGRRRSSRRIREIRPWARTSAAPTPTSSRCGSP